MPTLSVEADQVTFTLSVEAATAATLPGAVGGVTSLVVTWMGSEGAEMFPARSKASIEYV